MSYGLRCNYIRFGGYVDLLLFPVLSVILKMYKYRCLHSCLVILPHGEKNNETLSNHQNFGTHYGKSMSLKTMVTTDFRPELEIRPIPFLRMCKVNKPMAVSGFRSSKYSTSTNGAKRYKIAEIVKHCANS